MIEVFRTNVRDPEDASMLIFEIDTRFNGCIANFDLTDCDRILRIKHPSTVDPASFIELLGRFGYKAEVLSDDLPDHVLKQTMMSSPFIIERSLNAPRKRVWRAITNKDEMKSWYFDLAEFTPKVGFEFQFTGGKEGGTQYLHRCRITEVDPEKKITYSWRYEGYEGMSYVTFELFDEGDQETKVKLTHSRLDTFPKSNPDLAPENFEAGWTEIIGTHLKNFVEQ